MRKANIIVHSKQETVELANKIASGCKKGDTITLRGTLGAGKTFFVNAFVNALYKKEGRKPTQITSPTFNLVKSYETNSFPVYHFDLYRLKKPEELYEIGIEEALENGVCLIEWPKIAEDIITPNFLDIAIKHGDKKEERVFELKYY